MIRFNCLRCGASVSAPEACAGRPSKCKCGQQLTVPAASRSQPAPTGPTINTVLDQVDSHVPTSQGAGDLGKQRPQVRSSIPAGKPTATAAEATRGDTVARRSSGPTELPPQFGRYRVKKKLGGGGMGTVYLVENTELEREEALKVPHFSDGDDPQVRERFLREARSAAKLDHANLCPIYDAGVQDGIYYLTMRFLKGKLLSDYTGTAQPARKAVEIVTKLAQALESAHGKGVIHRDLKPSNVMMVGGVGPVVMDFGLAKQVLQPDQKLTQAGSMLGTPAYMPPEQVNGDLERMGPASDVYSLGVIFYELLTGQLPFEGPMAAVLGQILYSEPPWPSALVPGLNPALDGICRQAMAKVSTERYPSMKAFAAALMGYLRSTPATDGAGNLAQTAVGKAAIFQAPTAAPGPLPTGKADVFQAPTVAPGLSLVNRPAAAPEPGWTLMADSTMMPKPPEADSLSAPPKTGSSRAPAPMVQGTVMEGSASIARAEKKTAGAILAWLVAARLPKNRLRRALLLVGAIGLCAGVLFLMKAKEQPQKVIGPPEVVQPKPPDEIKPDEIKADEIKYDMDHLEKTYGVKFKAAKLQRGTGGSTLVTITLEFTKDLAGGTQQPLDILQNLFAGKPAGVKTQYVNRQKILLCYLLDEDSVAFTRQPPGKINGEVSGKKGDAFRITQTIPADLLAKTKVISFREEKSKEAD